VATNSLVVYTGEPLDTMDMEEEVDVDVEVDVEIEVDDNEKKVVDVVTEEENYVSNTDDCINQILETTNEEIEKTNQFINTQDASDQVLQTTNDTENISFWSSSSQMVNSTTNSEASGEQNINELLDDSTVVKVEVTVDVNALEFKEEETGEEHEEMRMIESLSPEEIMRQELVMEEKKLREDREKAKRDKEDFKKRQEELKVKKEEFKASEKKRMERERMAWEEEARVRAEARRHEVELQRVQEVEARRERKMKEVEEARQRKEAERVRRQEEQVRRQEEQEQQEREREEREAARREVAASRGKVSRRDMHRSLTKRPSSSLPSSSNPSSSLPNSSNPPGPPSHPSPSPSLTKRPASSQRDTAPKRPRHQATDLMSIEHEVGAMEEEEEEVQEVPMVGSRRKGKVHTLYPPLHPSSYTGPPEAKAAKAKSRPKKAPLALGPPLPRLPPGVGVSIVKAPPAPPPAPRHNPMSNPQIARITRNMGLSVTLTK